MSVHSFGAPLVLAMLLLTACDDVRADLDPETTPSASAPLVGCPARTPTGVCSTMGLSCEYGTDPDPRCNDLRVCTAQPSGMSWVPAPLDPSCSKALSCPPHDPRELDGTSCTLGDAVEGRLCPSTNGVCACTTGPDSAHAHAARWVCALHGATCPSARPLAGQPCSANDVLCDYGSCAFKRGVAMACLDGMWAESRGTCN